MDADRPDRPAVRRGAGWLVAALTVVLFLLLTAPAAAFWYSQSQALSEAKEARAADREVVDAATRHTLAWASVDYRDPEGYVETVEENATGDFLKEFKESQDALRQLLRSNRSVQVPTIPEGGAGLIERDSGVATVLVAMDATVTNKSTKTPQPRQYRLKVTLEQVDGEWLTSGLEFIDAQS